MDQKQKTHDKFIEFVITQKCNYKCEYCVEGNRDKGNLNEFNHASDKVVDEFIQLIRNLEGVWHISVLGGETLIHPRYMEVYQEIINNNHTTRLITNFSLPLEKYKELVDIAGDKLQILCASLHLSQVKSLDDFIEKADEFNKYKNSKTKFGVLSVLTEENFEILKEIKQRLAERSVNLGFQTYKVNQKEVFEYSDKIKEYFKQENRKVNPHGVLAQSTFGTICYSGYDGFIVLEDGQVMRCYNRSQELFTLGNIIGGNYKLFKKPIPCLAQKCNCPLFPSLNMLEYDNVDIELAKALVEFSQISKKAVSEINGLTGLNLKIKN
ncbi:MAG: radical SAM protein [Candidatus Gastranaerophilales bacterium]|nr:radical SAM protein [Candidatus Gastranaerophilales bacterium]